MHSMKRRLDQAVALGALTTAQAAALLADHERMATAAPAR